MTNRKYTNGRAGEQKIKDMFVDAGYAVARAAGSKGAKIKGLTKSIGDLFAFRRNGRAYWIECKRGSISNADLCLLFKTAVGYGVVPVLAQRDKDGKWQLKRVAGLREGVGGRGDDVPILIEFDIQEGE